jgi:hypothetical protein
MIAALFTAAFGSVGVAFAAPSDETVRGRVSAAHGGNIEVCFYDGYAPAAGTEFVLLRNVVVAAPKTQSPIRRVDVGAIRLSAAAEHGCAVATLLRGEAKSADWIVAPQNGSR